ncbi:hypothetical protein [Xanthomonas campestris]|uniref:hypothetical protein n=1 Tax=Xanthomonas campestris TaxID=339 RepID=UPI002B22E3A1|nr:hypothetical protein [Xanthomonas campestris]MEA9727476.1 hypothetical protein [Xanthomonas campestris pv. raphani]
MAGDITKRAGALERESGIGNRESGIGNRVKAAGLCGVCKYKVALFSGDLLKKQGNRSTAQPAMPAQAR